MFFILYGDSAPKSDQLTKLLQEIYSESDRAAAIIAGSLVEVSLTSALKAFFHPDKKITNELFRSTGALGAFATKICVGYLTGLYGQAAYKDLITIKDIRNKFAHSLEISDFQDQSISAKTKNLTLCDRYALDLTGMTAETETPEANPDNTLTIGGYRWWFGVPNLAEELKTPKGRYLVTAGALTFGLSSGIKKRAPDPPF